MYLPKHFNANLKYAKKAAKGGKILTFYTKNKVV